MSGTLACIFCGTRKHGRSVSHIVPESLGGSFSPVAPLGITCDACNQYFGQKVESVALRSFPFIGFRLLSSIPSKKRRMVSVPTTLGIVRAAGVPGSIELEPRHPGIVTKIVAGEVNQFRIMAEVTEPLAVCRMLLKIGLELLGKHFYEVAASERVSAALDFARWPKRGDSWWFALRSDLSEILQAPQTAGRPPYSIEIVELEARLCSVVRLPGTTSLIPLESGTLPPGEVELSEPKYRTVWATC